MYVPLMCCKCFWEYDRVWQSMSVPPLGDCLLSKAVNLCWSGAAQRLTNQLSVSQTTYFDTQADHYLCISVFTLLGKPKFIVLQVLGWHTQIVHEWSVEWSSTLFSLNDCHLCYIVGRGGAYGTKVKFMTENNVNIKEGPICFFQGRYRYQLLLVKEAGN